jgi:hypothetical protein
VDLAETKKFGEVVLRYGAQGIASKPVGDLKHFAVVMSILRQSLPKSTEFGGR